MTEAAVNVRKVGSVAVITTSGPLHGAQLGERLQALDAALDALATLSGIRAAMVIRDNGNHLSGAQEYAFYEQQCHRVCARLERLPIPFVAALHGLIQGVDLGVALACHYRVAASTTRFAAPEIGMGLIPDAGCTQRLPRLIGVEHTLELVLGTKSVTADTAAEWGLLDTIIAGDLQQGALIFAEQLIVDRKGPRRTSDLQVDPESGSDAVLDRFSEQAGRHYPNRMAPFTAIKAVRCSMQLPFARGVELETELLAQARHTTEYQAAAHVLAAEAATRELPDLAEEERLPPIKKVAIVGAGNMGAGISICCANAGVPVTVIDVDGDALERGLAVIDSAYESMIRRGRLTAAEKEKRFGLITGSLDYADLQHVDLVIESVSEDLELKRLVFARLSDVTRHGTVLATTTSTLDIDALSSITSRSEDVIGTHFFSPAQSMPLLEIVRTDATSPAVIRAVTEFAHTLRKMPVLVRARAGFIGNRMMQSYTREAKRLVLEGVAPQTLDELLEQWGMAMGPLAVTDLNGIDVMINVHAANAPQDSTAFQSDYALYEAGRLGQKNGKGYYHYDLNSRVRQVDAAALNILKARAAKLDIEQYEHSPQEIIERCLYSLINEGLRILEQGVAARAGDIDVVWIAGFGFPRYRGGPMFHADTIGLPNLLSGMRRYEKKFGSVHWQPARLLVELVSNKLALRDWLARHDPKYRQ